jgi:Tol biopolymer transport system component
VTDERWQLAYAIFEAAALLAESQRQQYVQTAAPDAEIAGKVLAMLEEMEIPADTDASLKHDYSSQSAAASVSGSLPNGTSLGRFVITGLVGQGGTTRLIEGLEAPPLPDEGSGVPPELDRLLRVMLSKAAADRPAASEVASRLEAIAQPRMFRRRTVPAAAALALFVLGGITVWRVLPFHRVDSKPVLLRSVPLDSEPASETAPAFSPDGRSVVYASDLGSPGIHHIMTRGVAVLASASAESNQPRTLTSGLQDDTNPVWSPDGSRIAFLRRTNAETLQAIVIPSGGGPETVTVSLPGFRPAARKYLTWTPDSKALVAAHRVKAGFTLRLYRFPISGGAAQPMTEGPDESQDVSPAFSPDGRWLAYLRWENGATYALWAAPQPGGKPRLLVTAQVPITTFAWKPDSQTIVYGGGPMSTGELRQVAIDGLRSLAPFALEGTSDQITIAPNGGRLAYVLQNLDANIWRVPLVDAPKTPTVLKFVDLASRKVTLMATLAKRPARFTRGLSISPDGRYALYCQNDADRYEIRLVENFRWPGLLRR